MFPDVNWNKKVKLEPEITSVHNDLNQYAHVATTSRQKERPCKTQKFNGGKLR